MKKKIKINKDTFRDMDFKIEIDPEKLDRICACKCTECELRRELDKMAIRQILSTKH